MSVVPVQVAGIWGSSRQMDLIEVQSSSTAWGSGEVIVHTRREESETGGPLDLEVLPSMESL